MALRNYLYAKHQHDTEIDTLINRDAGVPQGNPTDSRGHIDRSNRIKVNYNHTRRRIHHAPARKSPDASVEELTSEVSDMSIEEASSDQMPEKKKTCRAECNSCQCKKEAAGL
ncbi:uncharacterized protein SPAPADRAFT_61043, partial [Spathaspora passalidarum NRRL Y-27907]